MFHKRRMIKYGQQFSKPERKEFKNQISDIEETSTALPIRAETTSGIIQEFLKKVLNVVSTKM